jgi:hypothetical protein
MDEVQKRREQAARQTELRYEHEFYLLLNRIVKESQRLKAVEAVEKYHGSWRIRLAILKLSKGNLDALVLYIKAAQKDYSEVLNWAENPLDENETERMKLELGQWLIAQGREAEGRKIINAKINTSSNPQD